MPSNMNDVDRPDGGQNDAADEKDADGGDPASGPNLVLLYSLIALALAVAIALAALMVLPFYRRT
jgi:hypothetical protein